jgi:acyl-coenzyme A synthetase/AMP-(fatty) acid ligase
VQELEGRAVLIATKEQLPAALALLELDGVSSRLVLCPPDIPTSGLSEIVGEARIDAILTDRRDCSPSDFPNTRVLSAGWDVRSVDIKRDAVHETEWVLLTSGTTGTPKLVVHTLSGLTGAISTMSRPNPPPVWATFYDIRRYGGLQIFLRAALGGCSFLMTGADEPHSAFLSRMGKYGVTHISGTPSHWRRVLMSSNANSIAPSYVRLSGEIADQGILDGLKALYPEAQIVHAFASTEAGVGFEVHDGQAGFPASFLERRDAKVDMKVEDGSLWLRSDRAALRYLLGDAPLIEKIEGFIDTRDLVERRGDRYYFVGHKDGVINVGGQKVHPEEVEAVINRHPEVAISLVRSMKNPITGAVVIADVVLNRPQRGDADEALADDIRRLCLETLPRHKVPALVHFVQTLSLTPAGKLARRHE